LEFFWPGDRPNLQSPEFSRAAAEKFHEKLSSAIMREKPIGFALLAYSYPSRINASASNYSDRLADHARFIL
jgi:hypothetical protein